MEPFFSELNFISSCFTDDFLGHNEILSPGESAIVTKALPKRFNDFRTGRFCAREALNKLILKRPEILQGDGHEPLWPQNIVGSISHSAKLAGAVVAKSTDVQAIGLDIELLNSVIPEMWHLLFCPAEAEFIRQKETGASFWATLLFSFKESFY